MPFGEETKFGPLTILLGEGPRLHLYFSRFYKKAKFVALNFCNLANSHEIAWNF